MTVGASFEYLLSEWHVTPDYIVNHWTNELLDLMLEKLMERKKPRETGDSGGHKVSDSTLFARAGNLIEVVKKNGD